MAVRDNPWLRVLIAPRATIHEIVNHDPSYHVKLLAMLWGGLTVLSGNLPRALRVGPDRLAVLLPIFIMTFLGTIVAIPTVYTSAFILKWVGRLLGGTADSAQMRAATAWSLMPRIYLSALSVVVLLASGLNLGLCSSPVAGPDISAGGSAAAGYHMNFSLGLGISAGPGTSHWSFALLVLISLWSFFIFVQCLAEVHGFSTWRALGTIALFGVLVVGFVLGILTTAGVVKIPI